MNAIPASLGVYAVRDAARITGVPPHQIRGWLLGYAQRTGKPTAPPILCRQHEPLDGEIALGFLDLLEVAFLGKIVQTAARRGRAPRWRAIRLAAETARSRFGDDHPFAIRRIHTDGRGIFLEAQKETGDPALYDLVADNFAIFNVLVDSFVFSIDYDDQMPRQWVPDDRFRRIVIDPRRSFGRPIEVNSGVPAEALFDEWRAEKGDAAKVAAWYELDVAGVDQAVHYTLGVGEAQLAACESRLTRTCRVWLLGQYR